jgi:hypothetical protein
VPVARVAAKEVAWVLLIVLLMVTSGGSDDLVVASGLVLSIRCLVATTDSAASRGIDQTFDRTPERD